MVLLGVGKGVVFREVSSVQGPFFTRSRGRCQAKAVYTKFFQKWRSIYKARGGKGERREGREGVGCGDDYRKKTLDNCS